MKRRTYLTTSTAAMATGWVLPQFAVGILDGGLPGAGWEPGKPRIRLVPGLINSTK